MCEKCVVKQLTISFNRKLKRVDDIDLSAILRPQKRS
jgi:hypothetical protein